MNLIELRDELIRVCDSAYEHGYYPHEIPVSIQLDDKGLFADDIELTYDGNGCASGCVIHGVTSEHAKEQVVQADADGCRNDYNCANYSAFQCDENCGGFQRTA